MSATGWQEYKYPICGALCIMHSTYSQCDPRGSAWDNADPQLAPLVELILLVDSKSGLRSFIWARPPSIRRRRVRRLVQWGRGYEHGRRGTRLSTPHSGFREAGAGAEPVSRVVGLYGIREPGRREGNVRGPYVSYPTCILQYSHGSSACSFDASNLLSVNGGGSVFKHSTAHVHVQRSMQYARHELRTPEMQSALVFSFHFISAAGTKMKRNSTTRNNPVQTRQLRCENAAGVEDSKRRCQQCHSGVAWLLNLGTRRRCPELSRAKRTGLARDWLKRRCRPSQDQRHAPGIISQCSHQILLDGRSSAEAYLSFADYTVY
ncbi:hypothetical protein B0H11DRAFT_1899238 [Mycena galericulata]|nr:hypothetical protein B0H11DRAFT_1899238 [Mycena galericulata]